jgi:hypothetical protein
MSIFKKIKEKYRRKQILIMRHFWNQELNIINQEIIQNREYREILETKRDRVETLIFGK